MLVPVRCFTCGAPLGDLAPVYEYVSAQRMAKKYGSPDSEKMPISSNSDVGGGISDVLDSLKLSKCCRTHTVTAMKFCDLY